MPMKPQLIHRWTDLPIDTPMPSLSRRRIIGENAMISEITLQPGCKVPSHVHENEQFAIILSGHLTFGVGAEGTDDHREIEMKAGEVLHLPSNTPHSVIAHEQSLVLDVFSPPSEQTGIDRG